MEWVLKYDSPVLLFYLRVLALFYHLVKDLQILTNKFCVFANLWTDFVFARICWWTRTVCFSWSLYFIISHYSFCAMNIHSILLPYRYVAIMNSIFSAQHSTVCSDSSLYFSFSLYFTLTSAYFWASCYVLGLFQGVVI